MNPFVFVNKSVKYLYREIFLYGLWHFSSYFPLFPQIMMNVRPKTWRLMGAKIGKGCSFGYGVYLDVSGMSRLEIGNNVGISSECLILFHRRDMRNYRQGMNQLELPMIQAKTKIEDNAHLGMRAMIMPGVTIGKGAVVGANSLVTKDVPPYTVVAGQPAKVIKEILPPEA